MGSWIDIRCSGGLFIPQIDKLAAYFPTHSALKNSNWGAQRETLSAYYILHSMRERERELFLGEGNQKKKKIIDAHIHIIPEMNTWQFYN